MSMSKVVYMCVLLGACIRFLLLHNEYIAYLAAENNTCLFSHFSVGQKARHGSAGFSAQGLSRLASKVLAKGSHLRVRVLFQGHSGCWWNSVPFNCKTKAPVLAGF